MRGLDTNVLVRYLVQDDVKQARQASDYIRRVASEDGICFVNPIVLCELVWVLEAAYDCEKREILDVLERILMIMQFEIEQKDIVRQAVYDFCHGSGDLSDYLIGRINRAQDCEQRPRLTAR